jgi:hypothetical protein
MSTFTLRKAESSCSTQEHNQVKSQYIIITYDCTSRTRRRPR